MLQINIGAVMVHELALTSALEVLLWIFDRWMRADERDIVYTCCYRVTSALYINQISVIKLHLNLINCSPKPKVVPTLR